MGYYERLGKILRERLNSGESLFAHIEDASSGNEGEACASGKGESAVPKKRARAVPVPNELAGDFLVLGLKPGESMEECKSAWKLMLKMHHPDRHQDSESARKKAEQATINITRAYRRIEHWFATGKMLKD